MLDHKAKMVYLITIFRISEHAKKLKQEGRTALMDFIRKQIAPTVDYREWSQLEHDISELKKTVNRYMIDGLMTSLKPEKISSEAEKIFQDDISELDNKVRDEMKKIDLKKLKETIPKDQMEQLNNLFDMVLKEKGDEEKR